MLGVALDNGHRARAAIALGAAFFGAGKAKAAKVLEQSLIGGDVRKLDEAAADYVKVEAGDVPATVFLLENAAVVLEVKESFSDTMLKTLNFLPAKAVQFDSPEDVKGFSVKRLMEARVERELIGKPLLLKVSEAFKPDAAQLLALIAPNGLVVPAADVAAWRAAVADLKELPEDESSGTSISLRAPPAA